MRVSDYLSFTIIMFLESLQSDPRFFLAVVITVIVSICLHELAHGIAAIWLGDRTPIDSGHMTLNPVVHLGLFSVICLLVAGIAWGQMPVNWQRLRGKFGPALVAFAGPLSNILLAIIAIAAIGLWQRFDHRSSRELSDQLINLRYFLFIFGLVNMHLAIFNLIPIPPLDGSHILSNFSDAYSHFMHTLRMSGAQLILFLVLFSFAGNITAPMARNISLTLLTTIRGY